MQPRSKSLSCLLSALSALLISSGYSQIATFPYVQRFDSVAPPSLPLGWSSSQNRTPGTNDFTTTTGTPLSLPNAVLSTNATVGQSLISPVIDFGGEIPDRITFYTRRSATHLARVVVEASLDSGNTFPIQIGDSLTNPGSTNYVATSFLLPGSLANRTGVCIRWRVVPDVSGNTGTFRVDDVTLTVQTAHDLAIDRLRFDPTLVNEEDSVRAVALVKNVGVQEAVSFQVRFYVDLNNDSLPQPAELITISGSSRPILPGDSLEISGELGRLPPGNTNIIGQIAYVLDQNPSNDQLLRLLRIGYRPQSVVVNEIMYAPTNAEPEWVELYNNRPDSINIKDWLISDINIAAKKVISLASVFLPPHAFVVLTKDSAALVDVHPTIPSRIINIASMPTLNNTGDAVVVYDNRGITMDTLSYLPSWGGNTGGKSLERIDPAGASTAQTNWSSSRHPARSTPGRKNSVTRKDYDIALDTLFLFPALPLRGDSVVVSAQIHNIGFQSTGPFVAELFDDINADSIPQVQELLSSIIQSGVLPPLDSLLVFFTPFHPPGMDHSLIVKVNMASDEDTLNDISFVHLLVGIPQHSMVINEIMYSPVTEPEWVELYNTTAEIIDVKDWKLSNRNILTRYLMTSTPTYVLPHGYVVVAKDTALLLQQHPHLDGLLIQVPALPTFLFNNAGDAVVVYDGRSATMDSMSYLSTWGGNTGGKSLERVDPLGASTAQVNWGSSRHPDRSTPCKKNSVARKDYDIALDTLLLHPHSPLRGDSIIVSAVIHNPGFQSANNVVMRLYDDVNSDSIPQPQELLSTLVPSLVLPPLDSTQVSFPMFYPSRMEHLLIATVGMSGDEDTMNNISLVRVLVGIPPHSIVINEIMYSPVSEPEWVELYNTTAETVDVKGWKLSNRTTSSKYLVTATSMFMLPHGYVVVTKDTALLLQRYHHVDGTLVQVPALPTFLFNNTGDAVVFFDQGGQQLDSIKYATSWGGGAGTSLERLDAFDPSNDSLNWMSSTDSMKATPGRENSIATVDHDVSVLQQATLIAPPRSPTTLSATVKNIGRMPAAGFEVAFFDDRNRDSVAVPAELVISIHVSQSLARGETLRVGAQWPDPPPGNHNIIARVEYAPDLRLANNSTIFTVRIGYDPRVVVVNEIMYAPFTGEAEYVELANISTVDVDLTGWNLSDRPSSSGTTSEFQLVSDGGLLHPGEFFVIASDSTVFSRFRGLDTMGRAMVTVVDQSSLGLNNDGDAVIIRDATLSTIDSVSYLPAWHNPTVTDATGRSLEKIHPTLESTNARSWSTCVFGVGGTPGAANSIFTTTLPTQATISSSPNPFSPDGDGLEDFTVIHYDVPTDVSTVSLKLYDVKGRLIRYLVNNEPSGSGRDIVWDGYDDERQKARVGIYIMLLEGLNESGGNVYSAKGVVVLAAKLR